MYLGSNIRVGNTMRDNVLPSGSSVTYLLDDHLTNAVEFWSLHKVVSDSVYSGPLARHRVNTVGQPEYDINVAGDGLFVDTTQMLSEADSNTSYYSKLYGQLSTKDMVQSTTSKQYRAISSGTLDTLNSNPVMKSNNSATGYRTPGVDFGIASGPATIFMVYAHDGSASQLMWSADTPAANSWAEMSGATQGDHTGASSQQVFTHGVTTGTLALATFVQQNLSSDARINGVSKTTNNVGDFTGATYMDIGYQGAAFSVENIGEFLVFDANLGATAISEIEADIMSRWGIS